MAALLALAGSGCRRQAPQPAAKTQPASSKKAPASAPAKKPDAKAPAGAPEAKVPANATASAGAKGASAGSAADESPFPGQGGQAAAATPKASQGNQAAAAAPKAGQGNQAAAAAPKAAQATAVAAASASTPAPAELVPGVAAVPLPRANRCPFRVPMSPKDRPAGPAPRAAALDASELSKPVPGFAGVKPLPKAPSGSTPPLWDVPPTKPAPVTSAGVRSIPQPTAPQVPTAPPLQLTGVIAGPTPMAVLVGDKAHFIVREGDPVIGGFRVASISAQKVVLLSGNSRPVVLRFGGKNG